MRLNFRKTKLAKKERSAKTKEGELDRSEQSMTAGRCYDNSSFVDEEERKVQQIQPQPLPLPQSLHQLQLPQKPCNIEAGDQKPTLLSLSRSASVRYRSAGDVGLIGDLLARQIDQQRQSDPPLSRNPSVRFSRRFPPPALGVHLSRSCASSPVTANAADAVATAAAAAAAISAAVEKAATREQHRAENNTIKTDAQVHRALNSHNESSDL